MFNLNFLGTFLPTQVFSKDMVLKGRGNIINISSMTGFLGIFGYTAYGASKFAVTGFSEALRAEMKPHGILVSVAFPPDTDTPQLAYENQYKPPETKAISGTTKVLSAEKVAKEILYKAEQGHYLIFPGAETRLVYLLSTRLPKNLVSWPQRRPTSRSCSR